MEIQQLTPVTTLQRLAGVLVMATVVLYCSNVYSYFFQVNATTFKPLYWYAITIAIAGGLLLMQGGALLRGMSGWFGVWIFAFLCYGILGAINSSQSEVAVESLIERVEVVALLMAFMILLMSERGVDYARIALLFVVLLGVPMNVIDFLTPTWTLNPGRAAGLYLNSNLSGYMLVLAMVGCINLVPQRLRIVFGYCVGLGVLVTFSRSSWLLWAVAMIGLAMTGQFALRDSSHNTSQKKGPAILLVSTVSLLLVYGLMTGGVYDVIAASGYASKLTPDTFARLGAAGGAFADHSANSREVAALNAWRVFMEHPWFGAGLGYTREWDSTVEPHNLYLSVAAQGGIVGLVLILGLLVVLWRMTNANGKVLLLCFAVLSMFSHNSLEQPPMLVVIALIAAMGKQILVNDAEYPSEAAQSATS